MFRGGRRLVVNHATDQVFFAPIAPVIVFLGAASATGLPAARADHGAGRSTGRQHAPPCRRPVRDEGHVRETHAPHGLDGDGGGRATHGPGVTFAVRGGHRPSGPRGAHAARYRRRCDRPTRPSAVGESRGGAATGAIAGAAIAPTLLP